ncbi:MAG: hypothetical protein IJ999_00665 [Clostridia bacterium]|nr:hypothetical protein [Clostridia bacterium]
MKKLSLIMAMVLIATIGGVYATWNYSETVVSGVNVTTAVTLTADGTSGSKGTVAIDVINAKVMLEDDGHHTAVLQLSDGAKAIPVQFSPKADASNDVQTNGIILQCTITENFGNYTSADLTTCDNVDVVSLSLPGDLAAAGIAAVHSSIAQPANGVTFLLAAGAKTKSTTIDLSDFLSIGTIALPTLDAYNHFNSFLSSDQRLITISVCEYVAPVTP